MDIYFRPEYTQLCSLIDGGVPEEFTYQSNEGTVINRFLKRDIPILIDNTTYCDIITPYGYGGPLLICQEGADKTRLVDGYKKAFAEYCEQHQIVSEFIRFHPLYKNATDFQTIYETKAVRKTVGTDLARFEDPIQGEFGKSCRKNIRRALNAGVTYQVTRAPQSIDSFVTIYYSTMERDKAEEYYYFDKAYFDKMLELFRNDLLFTEAIYEDKVIAASICFVSDGNLHVHLSGTLSEYLHLSPAYILRYAVVLWGKENGLRMVHHGGGTTNTPDNPLYCFKKQFGKNTEFDFCIGKKIWNPTVYSALVKAAGIPSNSDFFPAYRKR